MRPRLPSSREQGVGQHCTGQGQPPALCPWAVCRLPGTRFPAFTPPLLAPRQQQAPQPRRPGWPSVHMKSSGLPGQAAPDTQPQPSRGALGRGPEGTQLARTPALGTHRGPTKALLSTCSVRTSPGGQWRLEALESSSHTGILPLAQGQVCFATSVLGGVSVTCEATDTGQASPGKAVLEAETGRWTVADPRLLDARSSALDGHGAFQSLAPPSALPRMSSTWREPTWQLWKLL